MPHELTRKEAIAKARAEQRAQDEAEFAVERDALNAQIAELQMHTSDLDAQIAMLEAEIVSLHEQHETDEIAIATLTQSLTAAEAQNAQLTADLETANEYNQDLLAQIDVLQAEIVEKDTRIKELEELLEDDKGTLWGYFPGPRNYPNTNPWESKDMMISRVSALYEGKCPVIRIFNEGSWDAPKPPNTPAIVSFSQNPVLVAAGQFDQQIKDYVNALPTGVTYWLCLNHEPDQPDRSYTPAQQVEGFKHFSNVVRSCGRADVKVTTILMSWTLTQGDADHWKDWYPGPEYVDAVGFDAYFRPYLPQTGEGVYGRSWQVAQEEGKPLLICETSAGVAGKGGMWKQGETIVPITEAQWEDFTTKAVEYLEGKAAVVTWFETHKVDGDWRLENHPAALAIYKEKVVNS